MDLSLETPIRFLPQVGPVKARLLEKLDIRTIEDLVYYPPHRYDDFTQVTNVKSLRPETTVTIRGEIVFIKNVLAKSGKRIQLASVRDGTGEIDIIWFNQPFLTNVLHPGSVASFAGKVNWFGKKLSLISPVYELLSSQPALHTGRLVPVYPETEGISSKWLRARIDYLKSNGLMDVTEYMPPEILTEYHLPDIRSALNSIHYPQSIKDAGLARRRLAFEELFFYQAAALLNKIAWQRGNKSPVIENNLTGLVKFKSNLDFRLTPDQDCTIAEIAGDMEKSVPMNRMLMGDVGSGKTVVAAAGTYLCYLNKMSSVIMAPTQILAQQHYRTLSRILNPLGVETVLFTATSKPDILPGKNLVYVGTHALLSQAVNLGSIGLVVIDEQQRFGVSQRQLLREKSRTKETPHLLTMTATPIPRSIAIMMLGSLDVSVIRQMPKGRKEIKTWVVPTQKRQGAYNWIRNQITANASQGFIVCPFIDESDTQTAVKAATVEYRRLRREIFPGLHLGLLHGAMSTADKNEVMDKFKNRQLHLLVATPVVEVGIDVPNATIMMVEGAERFGLSQLHQLRGRVGRGDKESYCLLFTENETDPKVTERLKAMEKIHNGPELAEIDLKIRGPGDLFGTKQHGLPRLKYASFMDLPLMQESSRAVNSIIGTDLELKQFDLLRERLSRSKISQSALD